MGNTYTTGIFSIGKASRSLGANVMLISPRIIFALFTKASTGVHHDKPCFVRIVILVYLLHGRLISK